MTATPATARGNETSPQVQIQGVLWTSSIIRLFAQKRPSDKLLAPTRCGNGHELTHDNLVLAECGTRLALPTVRDRARRRLAPSTPHGSLIQI